jgi:PAS domain-containing protein
LNPSFERVLGYSGEALMSRPFLEFVHPHDVERARDAFIQLATGADVIGFECRLVCADGSVRRFEWNARGCGKSDSIDALEGKSTKDAIRCLKRHLTRRIWHLLQNPAPITGQTLTPTISLT